MKKKNRVEKHKKKIPLTYELKLSMRRNLSTKMH